MKDFEERLVKERDELKLKIEKLTSFLISSKVNIPENQSVLLNLQLTNMHGYLLCLNFRIKDLKIEE